MSVSGTLPLQRPDDAGARFGTVLGVWAHPDDEAFLSAGLMLTARAAGQRVVVVTATDGERGGPTRTAWGRRLLARRRRRELAACLAHLDVREHRRLGYRDGDLPRVDARAAAWRLAEIIDDVRPDTIVTFGPDGLTGHSDHRAVSAWTSSAARLTRFDGRLWFATLTSQFHDRWGRHNERAGLWLVPDLVPSTPPQDVVATVRLSAAHQRVKLAALAAQRSQTSGLIAAVGRDTFAQWWATEWFRDGRGGGAA